MSHIDDLIQDLCPGGVAYKPLGDVGNFIRGNGLQKKDLREDGVGAIHYGQVFTHYGTSANATKSFVEPALAHKLRRASSGDLVIATTSENDEDVCKAVAWLGREEVAVSGDAYIFRHSLSPKYVAYFFQSQHFQSQKRRFISGTKVRRVSGKNLEKIRVPVPPLAVQDEIVRILDTFSALTAELEAELEARRTQYEHYRDELLTLPEDVPHVTMGDLAEIGTGNRNTNEAVEAGRYPFFVRSQESLAINDYQFDETAIITAGDGVGVGKVFHFFEGKYGLHQRAYRIRPDANQVEPRFLFHYIRHDFLRYLQRIKVHASVSSLRKPMFVKYPVPLPDRRDQLRIISVLDRFEDLTTSLDIGLPAEIEARRKQYEYYRDRLLSFEEAVA